MKLTEEQERNFLLEMLNRVQVQGNEVESLVEIKQRVRQAEIEPPQAEQESEPEDE